MRRTRSACQAVLILLLLPISAIAGPIPEPPEALPSDIALPHPAPILPQFPPQPAGPYVEPPYSPGLPRLVSGIRYYFQAGTQLSGRPASSLDDKADMHTRDSALLGSFNMSNDPAQDVEPSVIAIYKNGTIWTTTVYTQITFPPGTELPRNAFATTSDFSTRSKGLLPLPAGYQWSGDPFLAANPISSGVAPGRIYASGIVFNPPVGLSLIPNGIAVWHSDDGGQSWSNPALVAIENDPSFPARVLDKPAIAVSWHTDSLGHVYVVYIRAMNAIHEIWIAKSTDGGNTFGTPRFIATGAIQGPQVLVNPFYGHLYVLWTDFNAKAIKMSTSLDYGQSWSIPETATSINPIPGDPPLLNGSRAPSFPMAKFNPIANRISVVWHELDQPGTLNADVYYISKSASGLWQPAKVRINDVQSNDQFMPALDADTTGNGNIIVTFYDRRNDPNNTLYQVYSARIDPNGNRLEPNQLASSFQSDPRAYVDRFIGDYQDMWSQSYSGSYYYFPASVGITTGAGDIYVSGISPVAEFTDVPFNYWASAYIKAVVTRGAMFGCGAGQFCPTALVDRKMLADYIIGSSGFRVAEIMRAGRAVAGRGRGRRGGSRWRA